MAEIEFAGIEKQPIQVVPGDFYMNDDGVVVWLVKSQDGSTFALFNALSGFQYTKFMSNKDMFDYLNDPCMNHLHQFKSRILIA